MMTGRLDRLPLESSERLSRGAHQIRSVATLDHLTVDCFDCRLVMPGPGRCSRGRFRVVGGGEGVSIEIAKTMNRRSVLRLLGLGGAAALAAACSTPAPASPTAAPAKPADAKPAASPAAGALPRPRRHRRWQVQPPHLRRPRRASAKSIGIRSLPPPRLKVRSRWPLTRVLAIEPS